MNDYVITFSCADRPGLVHAITAAIVAANGNITELQQYASTDTGQFFMRVQIESVVPKDEITAKLQDVAARFEGETIVDVVGRPCRTLVLVSKQAHCLNALLSRQHAGTLPIDIPLIISNHSDMAHLAEFYGVPFEEYVVLPETKDEVEDRIIAAVDEYDIELVVLARYMQILSPRLVSHLEGRAINIHHSFLPGFKGANPYRQAHTRGVKLIGATAHFVTEELDEGAIIEQSVIPVDHSKSVEQLRELGQDIEATTLTTAVRLFAEHRILTDDIRTVVFD